MMSGIVGRVLQLHGRLPYGPVVFFRQMVIDASLNDFHPYARPGALAVQPAEYRDRCFSRRNPLIWAVTPSTFSFSITFSSTSSAVAVKVQERDKPSLRVSVISMIAVFRCC